MILLSSYVASLFSLLLKMSLQALTILTIIRLISSQQLNVASFIDDLQISDSNDLYQMVLVSPGNTSSPCILSTLENSMSQCLEESMGSKARNLIAIELTKCVFDENTQMPPMPASCSQENFHLEMCIGQLARDGVLWTTFFGYTNLVESFCAYYMNDPSRLISQYQQIVESFNEMMFKKSQGMNSNLSKLSQMVELLSNDFALLNEEINLSKEELAKFTQQNRQQFQEHFTEMDTKMALFQYQARQEQQHLLQVLEKEFGNIFDIGIKRAAFLDAQLTELGQRVQTIVRKKGTNVVAVMAAVVAAGAALIFRQNLVFVAGVAIGAYCAFM